MITLPSVMDIYDVQEMFSRYYVDHKIAQQNVPSKWKVKTRENGKALLLVMVQECKKMVEPPESVTKVPDFRSVVDAAYIQPAEKK